MYSVLPLLVFATLLVGLRGSAAQNFLAKSVVQRPGNSSSVPSAQSANHSEEDAFGAVTRELKASPPTWSRLSSPKQSVDWDGVGGAMEAGVGAIEAGVEFAKDPSVTSAGSALTSLGSLAMLAPPPAGPVVGGLMMLTGGLMSIFGGDQAPSNEDILTALQSGFAEVNEKLDNIDQRLIAVQAQLGSIERKLDLLLVAVEQVKEFVMDIRADVYDIYGETVLKKADMDQIDIQFAVIMQRMRLAMKDPSLMGEFTTRVVEERENLGALVYGVLSPKHLGDILDYELRAENGKCAAAISYQTMVAVRMKLFFIQFLGSIYSCPVVEPQLPCPRMTSATVQYAELLQTHLLEYEQKVKERGAEKLVQLSPSQLSPGMRAPKYVFNALTGHNRYKVSDQFVRDAAVLPVFGRVFKQCTNARCTANTCRDLQDHGIFDSASRALGSTNEDSLLRVREPNHDLLVVLKVCGSPVCRRHDAATWDKIGEEKRKFLSVNKQSCYLESRERKSIPISWDPKGYYLKKWERVGAAFLNKCFK